MIRYREGETCPLCKKGYIESTDMMQHCQRCGAVVWVTHHCVPFGALAPGETFYHIYRPDVLLVKRCDKNFSIFRRHNGQIGQYEANEPVIRAGNLTMRLSAFGHN